jgi:ATP-binding cassette subfamily B protein
MRLLLSYLRPHRNLVILALTLAAINQTFSLLDPAIFRHVISDYASQPERFVDDHRAFLMGVAKLFALMVGAAFVSRVAKNFQDYFLNVITQRVGARLYADGIRHSLSVPFAVFEDQRSGETLGKLQKVRSDVEKFISAFVNIVFTTLVGIVFVMVY